MYLQIINMFGKMRKFLNHDIFSLFFVILTQVNWIRSEDVPSDSSFALTNETIISNLLKSKVILNATDEDIINEFYYNNTDLGEEDYVDLSLLQPDKARDLFRIAKKKNLMAEMEYNRTIGRQARQSYYIWPQEAYYQNAFFVNKTMDLMAQSVYATRSRLRETRDIRRKFSKLSAYKMALMYGALMQLRLKMDNLFATMKHFNGYQTKFIWYLVLYERCISFNVDITQLVKEMFETHANIMKIADKSQEHGSVLNMGPPDGPPPPVPLKP